MTDRRECWFRVHAMLGGKPLGQTEESVGLGSTPC